MTVWTQDEGKARTSRRKPFEMLRRQTVQPRQSIRPTHPHHTEMRQVHGRPTSGEFSLLGHRVSVVPRNTFVEIPFGGCNRHHGLILHVRHSQRRTCARRATPVDGHVRDIRFESIRVSQV